MAATPSPQTMSSLARRPCRNASCVRRTSPGLSSTRRIWTEPPLFIAAAPCPIRQGEPEGAATPDRRFDPYAAPVALDDPLADREPDAAARIFLPRMQPPEYHKDVVAVFRRDADAMVANVQMPFFLLAFDAEFDLGWPIAAELDRVADQVLVELDHLMRVGSHGRQIALPDRSAGLLDERAKVQADRLSHVCQVDRDETSSLGADSRVSEQIVDEALHSTRAVHREADVLVGFIAQGVAVFPFEKTHEPRHHPQRLLQIVAGDVGELLQVGIGASQLFRATFEPPMRFIRSGDVMDDRRDSKPLTVPTPYREERKKGAETTVVFATQERFVDLRSSRGRLRPALQVLGVFVYRRGQRQGLADRLRGRVPEQSLCAGFPVGYVAAGIDCHNAVGARFDDRRQPRERRLRLHPLRNVPSDSVDPTRSEIGHRIPLEPARGPVGGSVP